MNKSAADIDTIVEGAVMTIERLGIWVAVAILILVASAAAY